MKKRFKILGPGILFASTAIGVSHLVQSTRAGMEYGLGFLVAIILINVVKYPFFEYGSRYAAATGTSLIDGYKKLGLWAIGLYFIVMIVSLFFVSAAVFYVTAAFLDYLLGINVFWGFKFAALFIVVCSGYIMLLIGKFKALDIFIKIIGSFMLLCTITAFIMVLYEGPQVSLGAMFPASTWTITALPFAISLMGWMPTAVDLSTWNSLWTIEKQKTTGTHATVKEIVNEFAIGYWISAILAILFLFIGAYLVYGTAAVLEQNSAKFANQVISLFTMAIGSWSFYIIAIAAFTIMYGTSIGVIDGYARAFERTIQLLFSKTKIATKSLYALGLTLTAAGGLALCVFLADNGRGFLFIIDAATVLSFLFAPIVAFINYKLVTNAAFPNEHKPGKLLRVVSVTGIAFLTVFSLAYVLVYLGYLS